MGVRGRKSAAALALVGPSGIESVRRPAPPADLTDEQKVEWVAVVNRLPADWFPRETHPMLVALCCSAVSYRRLNQMVVEFEGRMEDLPSPPVMEAFDRLLKMRQREASVLSSLSTRMRISQHATYDKTRRKPIQAATPWEPDQEAGGPGH